MEKILTDKEILEKLEWRDQLRSVLRRARTFRNKTQDEIAVAVGRSGRQVRRIENGESPPDEVVFDRWMRACGVVATIELVAKW